MQKQIIYGTCPSKSNCYKIIKLGNVSSLGKTPTLKKYENDFYIQCNVYRDANIDGYFEFFMDVFYPNERSDLDNSLKVVLDCLQKVKAIKNDNKCVKIVVRKFLDKANPRVEFGLRKVEGL
jgi:Holliday junction resolvase RusA-like endonuclease